ncbi:MAG: DUF2911 domain-containing protein [Ferruginibacter sp.]
MKKMTITIASCFFIFTAIAQLKMPQPSPIQTIKQEFALGSIEVKYSRTAAKDRKVFGDLVPMNQMWRTGANGATIVRFTDAVEINGKKVDTGSYALYTIPGNESWEIILNKGVNNWGIDGYKELDDVLRFKVTPMNVKKKVESITIQIANIKPETCEMHIMWEKTAVSIPIKATIKSRIQAQLEEALKGDKKPYWQAAQFYNEYDNNPSKALTNINEAVKENPKAFWMWLYKAKLEKTLGDKAAAMESSKTSMQLATEAKNVDYQKMNKDLQKKLK